MKALLAFSKIDSILYLLRARLLELVYGLKAWDLHAWLMLIVIVVALWGLVSLYRQLTPRSYRRKRTDVNTVDWPFRGGR